MMLRPASVLLWGNAKFYHLFLEDQTEKTVKQVISASAGFASDTELRDCLRIMEQKMGPKGRGLNLHYYA